MATMKIIVVWYINRLWSGGSVPMFLRNPVPPSARYKNVVEDGGITFLPDLSSHPTNYSLGTVQNLKLDVRIRPQRSEFNLRTIHMDFVGDNVAPKNSFSPMNVLSIIPPYLS